MQETWLFSFQQTKLLELFPDHASHTKAVDDNEPIPMNVIPRGYGGVATLWKSDKYQPKSPTDGSNRITVITSGKIALINVYMPCRGSYTNAEFQDELDKVEELCQKFSSLHIIVAGDFNVDVNKTNDVRVKYFKKFLNFNNLEEAYKISTPTFRHHNGIHTSKIDYILINKTLRNVISAVEYRVLEHDPQNSSSHDALLIKLYTKEDMTNHTNAPRKATKWSGRPLWDKCDKFVYEEALSKYLDTDTAPSSTELAIDYFTRSIIKATKEAVPFTKPKPKNKPWNPEIAQRLKDAKAADAEWKKANKPGPPHALFNNRKQAKKAFRSAQRIQSAKNRCKNLATLQTASEDNSKLFYSIIKKQREGASKNTKELFYEGKLYCDDLLPVWQAHFSSLAMPSDQPNYSDFRFNLSCENINNIQKTLDYSNNSPLPIPITKGEVTSAIRSLKRNKAKDSSGLAAEHLQSAIHTASSFLTPVINEIFSSSHTPVNMKEGILHPVHKKGKDVVNPGNHRGITISALTGKVLDKLSLQHQRLATPSRLHPLQFGFTQEKSGTHAAFILNEAIAEAQDTKMPLFTATLDVQKAFDVVRHQSLLDKLHQQGLPGRLWKLKEDSYRNLTCRVLWEGNLSKPFTILQGNRQGAYPSPDDYLSYLVKNLQNLSATQLGFYIGNVNVSTPTCADDMLALSSNMYDLQVLLGLIANYANSEHYTIHPDKSMIIPFNLPSLHQRDHLTDTKPWTINGDPLPVNHDLVHVGIQRNLKGINPTIEHRSSLGRKTLYALMGSGMVGRNGLPVMTSLHIYNVYVAPRITYGLESLSIGKEHIKPLEIFQRSTLRSLLYLPDRTAIASLYILTGQMPMEAIIHKKALSFLHALIKSEGPTKRIIERQYALKKKPSKSWIIYIKDVLQKYSLPSVCDLLQNLPSKLVWKKQCKKAIFEKVVEDTADEALSKSTLRYLNPVMTPNQGHLAVYANIDSQRQISRANIKIRLLTGTYTLQFHQHKFGKAPTDVCSLCQKSCEDTPHFLLECDFLKDCRSIYIPQISNFIPYVYQNRTLIFSDRYLLVQLILDASHPSLTALMNLPLNYRSDLECITRNFIYKLHLLRAQELCKRINK